MIRKKGRQPKKRKLEFIKPGYPNFIVRTRNDQRKRGDSHAPKPKRRMISIVDSYRSLCAQIHLSSFLQEVLAKRVAYKKELELFSYGNDILESAP